MLNIEVIKFEAQDVITTSVAAPTKPTKPVKPVQPAPTEAPTEPCAHSDTVAGEHIHAVHGYHEGDRYCKACGELVWC